MKRIITLLTICACAIIMSACSLAYRPTIQQGAVLKPAQVARIKVGMSRQQILAILGQPVRDNTFSPDKLIYVYTVQPNHSPITTKQLIISFRGNRATRIDRQNY